VKKILTRQAVIFQNNALLDLGKEPIYAGNHGSLKANILLSQVERDRAVGTDAGLGDSFSHAAMAAGVAIMVSNSIGVKRPSAA